MLFSRSVGLGLVLAAVLAAVLAGVLAMTPVSAQQRAPGSPGAPDATTIAAAKDLLMVMGTDKQFDIVIPMMMQQMRGLLLQQKPGIQKELDDGLAALATKFSKRKGEIIDQIAVIYAQQLTLDDIKATTVFFKSPAGTRYVAAMPKLMQDSSVVGRKWGEALGQEVERELRDELKRRGVTL